MTAATFPPDRYGHRRAPAGGRRRWIALALAGLVIIGAVAVASLFYRSYGDPTYQAQVIRFTDITDAQVVVEFRVAVPPGGSAVCLVRARSRDGVEVGRAEVPVTAAAGSGQARTSYRLATTGRPVTGEVAHCRPAK